MIHQATKLVTRVLRCQAHYQPLSRSNPSLRFSGNQPTHATPLRAVTKANEPRDPIAESARSRRVWSWNSSAPVFGAAAPASLRIQVKRSLNTLRIAPAPAREQPTALCRAGRWTYCPQAAWVYQVVRAAHVIELGNLGTRAIAGLAGNRSFSLWTTKHPGGRLGGRCHLIAGVTVCRVGHRLAWRIEGLVFWLQPAASPTQPRPSGRVCQRQALCGAWSQPPGTSQSGHR
jgi:hypothetical protein